MDEKIEKHDITLANFNCTFGEKDLPMLEHFDDIIYPAFTSGLIRPYKSNTSFFFLNVRIEDASNGDYVLVGNVVKETKLEVKSHYIEGKGIVNAYEVYPSSPYSIFAIFLKNHRMVFYRNQSGSPILSAFKGTADFLIKKYLLSVNKNKTYEDALPFANIKIVPIPSKVTITDRMHNLATIKSIKFNIFPLNNDIGISAAFDSLRDNVSALESKKAQVYIPSPKSKENVAKLIGETQGTVEAVIEGKDYQGNKITLKNDSFTEKLSVDIKADNTYLDNTNIILSTAFNHPAIKTISEQNSFIYQSNIDIIKQRKD